MPTSPPGIWRFETWAKRAIFLGLREMLPYRRSNGVHCTLRVQHSFKTSWRSPRFHVRHSTKVGWCEKQACWSSLTLEVKRIPTINLSVWCFQQCLRTKYRDCMSEQCSSMYVAANARQFWNAQSGDGWVPVYSENGVYISFMLR